MVIATDQMNIPEDIRPFNTPRHPNARKQLWKSQEQLQLEKDMENPDWKLPTVWLNKKESNQHLSSITIILNFLDISRILRHINTSRNEHYTIIKTKHTQICSETSSDPSTKTHSSTNPSNPSHLASVIPSSINSLNLKSSIMILMICFIGFSTKTPSWKKKNLSLRKISLRKFRNKWIPTRFSTYRMMHLLIRSRTPTERKPWNIILKLIIHWKLNRNSKKLVKHTTWSWRQKIKSNFNWHLEEAYLEISQRKWIKFSAPKSGKTNQNISISHHHHMLRKEMERIRKLQLKRISRKMESNSKWSGMRSTTQTEAAKWLKSMMTERTSRRKNSLKPSS